jgi:hypothetical protein
MRATTQTAQTRQHGKAATTAGQPRRAPAPARTPSVVDRLLHLQRTVGNAAVARLIGSLAAQRAPTAQREALSNPPAQVQREHMSAKNDTGLPDGLKSSIKALSGISMDGVKLHYNSSQRAHLNALAYAQSAEIHIAPGQGREADVMGQRMLSIEQGVVQRVEEKGGKETPAQKIIESVQKEVKKMDFTYCPGSDCRKLAEDTLKVIKNENITNKCELMKIQQGMLVANGPIKGDDRTSNTEGDTDDLKMWYFEEHFWLKIEGTEYDPLFNKIGERKPEIDLEKDRPSYKDCYISKFESGKAMVHRTPHILINADRVFKNIQDAKEFVDEKNPNYTSDSE